jgi:hypothetical protein
LANPPTGDLIVSSSQYAGTAATVTPGQALPGGGVAVADGTYPGVFANDVPDPSFGVTSPVYLDRYALSGSGMTLVSDLPVPTAQIVTSFSSKSELSLNLSTDGLNITFMGYVAPVNTLDASNANTAGHVDPTNLVTATFARGVAQFDATGASNAVQVTSVNTYSGNNGRAAILDSVHNQYFLAGNAGNGSGTQPVSIVNNTGVQIATPGGSPDTTVVGVQQGTAGAKNGFQFGFSVTQLGYAADKSGKDDNFRGIAIFNNTLFVTKGSGSNGINTVYQVDGAGSLPTLATASTTRFSILPGFPTGLANATSPVPMHPFGLFFADSNTL